MMKLRELLNGLDILETNAGLDSDIREVRYDSRLVESGDLFIAVTGVETDGHKYIPMAREKGAACVLCERAPEDGAPFVRVADSRRALAVVGGNRFDHPAREMTMIGITGTSGKTTSTYLIKSILEQKAGAKVGLIGTIQNMIGDRVLHTERTTPESFELQKLLREMADAGCTHVVMEVSSHALMLDRVYGIPFAVGIYTNLSRDHLDFHKTMEAYCDAKALLMRQCDVGIYNADDPLCVRIAERAANPSIAFGVDENLGLPQNSVADAQMCQRCSSMLEYDYRQYGQLGSFSCPTCGFARPALDFAATGVKLGLSGLSFDVRRHGEGAAAGSIAAPYTGAYMVYNLLATAAAAGLAGCPLPSLQKAIDAFDPQNGRLQTFDIAGRRVLLNLAKNPTGFNQNLKIVAQDAGDKVVAFFVNDKEGDGRDVSWLWDIDFEELAGQSGLRVFAGGIRKNDDPAEGFLQFVRGAE